MTIETDYGTVEYEEENLITFSDGVFGFPELKRYLFLTLNEEDDCMCLMLSVDDPNVGFVIMNPYFLCPDYAPALTSEELSCLEADNEEELSYYCICVVHDNYLDNTVNLKCPLVINPETCNGIQVILANSPYGCHHELRSFPTITDSANTEDRK